MNISQYKLSQCSIGDKQDVFHICDVDLGFCSNPSPFYFFCRICDHLSKISKDYKTSSQSIHTVTFCVMFLTDQHTKRKKHRQTNNAPENIISLAKKIIIAKLHIVFTDGIFLLYSQDPISSVIVYFIFHCL